MRKGECKDCKQEEEEEVKEEEERSLKIQPPSGSHQSEVIATSWQPCDRTSSLYSAVKIITIIIIIIVVINIIIVIIEGYRVITGQFIWSLTRSSPTDTIIQIFEMEGKRTVMIVRLWFHLALPDSLCQYVNNPAPYIHDCWAKN